MLVTALERERKKAYKKAYQEGRKEGRKEGHKEGQVETQRQTILQLLQFRFELDEAEAAKFAHQLAQIHDSQILAGWINSLLRTGSTLGEITEQLAKSLSAAKPE